MEEADKPTHTALRISPGTNKMVAIKSLAVACLAGVAAAQIAPPPENAASLVNPTAPMTSVMASGGSGCWSLDYNYLGMTASFIRSARWSQIRTLAAQSLSFGYNIIMPCARVNA
jgi:hypothetical protein